MIRFNKVWDLYGAGKILEEKPVKAELQRLKTDHGIRLTRIIEAITNFDPTPISESIRSIDFENPDKESLEKIINNIEEAEKNADSYLSLEIPDNYIFGHIVRTIKIGDEYDGLIANLFDKLSDKFASKEFCLRKSKFIKETEAARNEADSLYIKCAPLLDLAARRGIFSELETKKASIVRSYGAKRERIAELQGYIDRAYKNYSALEFDGGALMAINLLRKELRKGFPFTKTLHRECKAANYHEGTSRIERLQKELDYVSGNFMELKEKYHKIKELFGTAEFLKLDFESLGPNYGNIEKLRELAEESKSIDFHTEYAGLRGIFNSKISSLKGKIGKMLGLYEDGKAIAPGIVKPSRKKENRVQEVGKGAIMNLPVYLQSIGYPPSTDYYPLRSSLLENNVPYPERLKKFGKLLGHMGSTDDAYTLDWISQVRFGIEQCLEQGQMAMEINSKKSNRRIADNALGALDRYMKTSGRLLRGFGYAPQ